MKMVNLYSKCLIIMLTIFSCTSNHSTTIKVQPKKTEKVIKKIIKNVTLFNVEDNYYLKDSATFFKLAKKIIETGKFKEYVNYGELSQKVFQFLYEKSDEEVGLNRKMDLLILLVKYHRHATDAYRANVMGFVKDRNKNVLKNKFLLLPICASRNCKLDFIDFVSRLDSIETPKFYHNYSESTLKKLRLCKTKGKFYKNLSDLNTELYKVYSSLEFQNKYKKISREALESNTEVN